MAFRRGRPFDHPQIAPQGQLETAGHRVAGDGGDHRFRKLQPRRSQRREASGAGALERIEVPRGDRFQVGARAEMAALAPKHRDRRRGIILEFAELMVSTLTKAGRSP